jgi:hypothetical protein
VLLFDAISPRGIGSVALFFCGMHFVKLGRNFCPLGKCQEFRYMLKEWYNMPIETLCGSWRSFLGRAGYGVTAF